MHQGQATRSADQLRSLIFAQGVEERVEVNQRHLIDKILARYSSEFTLFRELIQNANDAGATDVQVRLSTAKPAEESASTPSLISSASSAATAILNIFKWGAATPDAENASDTDKRRKGNKTKEDLHKARLGTCAATEIEIRNNGRAFSGDDWNRVRRIAEGNPNSEACGMFGVGFYSVFAVTEQPIVKSGNEYLAFHWKGDMLVTTRGTIESSDAEAGSDDPWVSFILEGREPLPLDLDQLCKFLVKSVAFTTNVHKIELFVDGQSLFQVNVRKDMGERTPIKVPKRTMIKQKDGLGLMTIASLEEHQRVVEITAYPDVTPSHVVSTRQISAQVDVHWEAAPTYLENMKRILKKSPPSRTNILMLYNFETLDKHRDQFAADLYPSPNSGHVYIGFSTHQTTGTGFHIAAQLIPTVERESIDFNDVYISNWNCNLLSIAGQVSRLYYEHRLSSISQEAEPKDSLSESRLVNLLEAYSFVNSHPSAQVNTLLSQYFFLSPETLQQNSNLPVPSTHGVVPCSAARLPHLRMEDFILAASTDGISPSYSIISRDLFNTCQRFFQQLVNRKLVRNVSFDEMITSLQRFNMPLDTFSDLVKWYTANDVQNELFGKNLKEKNTSKLLNAVSVRLVVDDDPGQPGDHVILQDLSKIKYFATNKAIRALPVPSGTVHPLIASICKKDTMQKGFGWTELSFAEWWKHAKRNPPFFRGEFTQTAAGSKRSETAKETQRTQYFAVMSLVAEQFAKSSEQLKQDIVAFLKSNRSILVDADESQPLTFFVPSETYMPRVQLFKDIVHVSDELMQFVGKPFLKQLGVRDTVELRIVLDRLEELSWDIQDLVTFLTDQQSSFGTAEWDLLKRSAFLPGMSIPSRASPSSQPNDTESRSDIPILTSRMHKASELYFPHPQLLELGFEVLAWPSQLPRNVIAHEEPTVAEDNAGETSILPKLQTKNRKKKEVDFTTGSRQAQLLFKIGLKNVPSIHSLVKLASSGSATGSLPFRLDSGASIEKTAHNRVLSYMKEHIAELLRAEPSFSINNLVIPFVPATIRLDGAYARSLERTLRAAAPIASTKARNKKSAQGVDRESASDEKPGLLLSSMLQSTEAAESGPELHIVCLPKACFLNDSPFGFPVVDDQWRELAQRLGVVAHPPLTQVIEMIIRESPATRSEAQNTFEYLFLRLNDFTKQDWAILRSSSFIPVFEEHDGEQPDEEVVRHVPANQVFIHTSVTPSQESSVPSATAVVSERQGKPRAVKGKARNRRNNDRVRLDSKVQQRNEGATATGGVHVTPKEVYDNLLDFVDFGSRANFFLKSCGVSEIPSVEQLAYNFILHHKRYLAKNGVRRYLHLLKVFAAAYPQLEGASVLIAQLSQTPFCVAYMYEDESSTSDQSRPDPTTKEIAVVKRANECYLIDNERLSKLFNPPRVPPIEGSAMLARMYENLGARWITSDLQQKTLPRGTPKITEATREFKQLLNERKPLLTHTMQGKPRKHLRPDAERILDNMKIFAVDRIERVLHFKGKKVHEDATISIVHRRRDDVCLYMTEDGNVDYFDVGTELVPLLYAKPKHDDALLVAMLLQTSIPALRRGGWPVDRLLQLGQVDDTKPQKGDAYQPLRNATPPSTDGTFSAELSKDSNPAEPKLRKTTNEADVEVIKSNTFTESSNTRDDRRAASGREHQREMNRQLSQAMRSFSAQAPSTVKQEAGEKRSVHYSCEVIPQQTLKKVANVQGVDLYIELGVTSVDELMQAAQDMSTLLRKLAGEVFSVPLKSFKMFVANSGNRIAFNLDRAIYFNLGIYADLHYQKNAAEALSFWYMTTCHELAHNTYELHNEEHGALLEWIAHTYMAALHRHLPSSTSTSSRRG